MRSGAINTLTGDTGGPVGPDASENINILGGTGVDVAGVPATSTLTVSVDGTVPTTFQEDTGTATPAANVLIVAGGTGCSTTGAGNTVTVDLDPDVPESFPTDSGTATPAANALTVSGGTLLNTAGAGAVVTINADAAVAASFPTDSGTATPAANALTVAGGTGVTTSGAGSTLTINAAASVPTQFTGDSGTANPAANNINLLGGTGLSTSAAGSTVTFNASAATPLSFPTDSGTATPAANALSILGGTGISTSGSGSAVTVNSSGGGFAWVEVTGTSQNIAVSTGYIANNAGSVTFTLPATAALGDTFKIVGKGAGGWSIAQNAGQTIRLLASATTTGAGGTLTPDEALATIQIVCTTPNTDFIVDTGAGNFVLA